MVNRRGDLGGFVDVKVDMGSSRGPVRWIWGLGGCVLVAMAGFGGQRAWQDYTSRTQAEAATETAASLGIPVDSGDVLPLSVTMGSEAGSMVRASSNAAPSGPLTPPVTGSPAPERGPKPVEPASQRAWLKDRLAFGFVPKVSPYDVRQQARVLGEVRTGVTEILEGAQKKLAEGKQDEALRELEVVDLIGRAFETDWVAPAFQSSLAIQAQMAITAAEMATESPSVRAYFLSTSTTNPRRKPANWMPAARYEVMRTLLELRNPSKVGLLTLDAPSAEVNDTHFWSGLQRDGLPKTPRERRLYTAFLEDLSTVWADVVRQQRDPVEQAKTWIAWTETRTREARAKVPDRLAPSAYERLEASARSVMQLRTVESLVATYFQLMGFYEENGRFPDRLTSLQKPANDPWTPNESTPLGYRQEGKGFRLWSVGQDRVDQGGRGPLDQARAGSSTLGQNDEVLTYPWTDDLLAQLR